MAQFSVRLYATGALAEAIADYRDQVSHALGKPVELPYCPLTNDFPGQDDTTTYVRHLDDAIVAAPQIETAVVEIVEPHYSPPQHELELSSDWTQQVMARFKKQLQAVPVALTLRNQLRLVLASPADEAQHEVLLPLSEALDWSVRAGWDMKLYQCLEDDWVVEGTWPIQQP
ncbi:MAG: hypothetical protein WBA10_06495 [Elainellaceae cyanobacterium]